MLITFQLNFTVPGSPSLPELAFSRLWFGQLTFCRKIPSKLWLVLLVQPPSVPRRTPFEGNKEKKEKDTFGLRSSWSEWPLETRFSRLLPGYSQSRPLTVSQRKWSMGLFVFVGVATLGNFSFLEKYIYRFYTISWSVTIKADVCLARYTNRYWHIVIFFNQQFLRIKFYASL